MNEKTQMTDEVWKPVVGYEGLYEVSSLGRVKSLPKYHQNHERILSQYVNSRNGYCYVGLCRDNISKQYRVHILVMEAFTEYKSGRSFNPNAVIDHLDCDKTNNALSNLEVCTHKENMERAHRKIKFHYFGIPVIDLDTMEEFENFTDAARAVGGSNGESVRRVCDGLRSHYRNHHYARLSDYRNGTIPSFKGKNTKKASESLWR